MAAHVDQFKRTTAEIADDAVRFVDARRHAERGQPRLPRTGQNVDGAAANTFRLGDEVRPVGRVAARRGGDRMNFTNLHHPAQRLEAP